MRRPLTVEPVCRYSKFKKFIMPKLIFTLILISFTRLAAAQPSGFLAAVAHPITIGDTFLSQYEGGVSLGLEYRHSIGYHVSVRPSVEYETYSGGGFAEGVDLISLSAFAGIGFDGIRYSRFRIDLEGSAGYTSMRFTIDRTGEEVNMNGVSVSTSVRPQFDISSHVSIGAIAGYKATLLEKPKDGTDDTAYNRQLHALRFGLTATYRL